MPGSLDLATLNPLTAALNGSLASFLANAKLLDTVTMLATFLGPSNYGAIAYVLANSGSIDLDNASSLLGLLQNASLSAADKQSVASFVAASKADLDALAATATSPAGLIANTLAVEDVAQESATASILSARAYETSQQQRGAAQSPFAAIQQAYTGSALAAAIAAALGQTAQVISFLPAGASPTAAATVHYTLTFSQPVSGVAAGDFSVIASGGLTAARVVGVSAVAGSGGASDDLAVQTGAGQGTLAVAFAADNLSSAAGTPLNEGRFGEPVFTSNQTDDYAAVQIAVGDFNGDGKLDVALGNEGGSNGGGTPSSTFSVLLGNGDGTFQAPIATSAPLYLTEIAAGDFNGDGKLDLVALNSNPYASTGFSSLQVELGTGDGSFTPGAVLPISGNPSSVVVADLNHDGHADIVATDDSSNDVAIYFGKGDGTFQAPTIIATGSRPTGLAVGELNGDGIPDLVVVNAGAILSTAATTR